MHLRRRQQVTTVGVAVVATALSLAACSSSSSSSAAGGSSSSPAAGSSSSSAALSGTLNGSGSTLQLDLPGGSHLGLQDGPVRHDGQLRCRRLGQGAHGPGLGGGQLRGLGLADPCQRGGELQRQDGALLPRRDRPGHGLVQPVRPQQAAAAVGAGHREHLPGKITTWNNSAIAADNPGVTLPSTAITVAVRSDSSGTTQNFTQFLVDATGDAMDARQQLDHQVALHRPRRQRQRRGGIDHQVHPRGRRVRGLLRRQGLRADVRFYQEQGRRATSRRRCRGLHRRQPASPSSPT